MHTPENISGTLDATVPTSGLDALVSEHVGIEDAGRDSESEDNTPFDPRLLSLSSKWITMDALVRRFRQNTLLLNPDFQRKDVWTHRAKSRLIESLILRIPIPMFYFSSDVKNVFTVVDGLQRLSAIRDFVLGIPESQPVLPGFESEARDGHRKMTFEGLEYLTEWNGRTIDDLPTDYQNRIMETEFAVTIIEPNTPEEVKRNIFRRINTGGMPLVPQEIRNALYAGPATRLLNELASDPTFLAATTGSINSMRADDNDIILRLLSFMLRAPERYKSNDMDAWLSVTMQIINCAGSQPTRELAEHVKNGDLTEADLSGYDHDAIVRRFRLAMTRAHRLFGRHAFRRSVEGNRSSITKPLFEMWGVILSDLTDSDFASLLANRAPFIAAYAELLDDPTFLMQISKNSSKAAEVAKRFSTLRRLTERFTDSTL